MRNQYRHVVEVPKSRNSLRVRNRINGCADTLTMINQILSYLKTFVKCLNGLSKTQSGRAKESEQQLLLAFDALDAGGGGANGGIDGLIAGLASSVPLRFDHRPSTGLSSGAYAGSLSTTSQCRWVPRNSGHVAATLGGKSVPEEGTLSPRKWHRSSRMNSMRLSLL